MSGEAPGTVFTALDAPEVERDWPDLETALVRWLPTVLTTPDGSPVHSDTVLSLRQGDYFVRVSVTTAPNDGVTQFAMVDIDTFAPTRAVGYDLGKQVGRALERARRIDGVLIDGLLTVSGPKRVPWENASTTRRHLATYRISTRRQEGAPQW